MARFKITHSADAACIQINGDKLNPEPSTAIIRFPGGCVEVARCSDGSYWCHVSAYTSAPDEESPAGRIVESRIDYRPDDGAPRNIPPIPGEEFITHMAIRVEREQ